jgi:hypothetical protein
MTRGVTAVLRLFGLVLIFGAGRPSGACAQETVQVSIPAGVAFAVTNIASATTGAPAPTPVTFAAGTWPPPNGLQLILSVRADAASFTPPAGGAIPATRVSWTATAGSGTAFNNTLTSAAYRRIYRGPNNGAAGAVNVTWQLAALTGIASLRAGTHVLTMRWRVEVQ